MSPKNLSYQLDVRSRDLVPAELLRVSPSGASIRGMRCNVPHGCCNGRWTSFGHGDSRFAAADDLWHATHIDCDDWRAAGNCFEQYVRPTLATRREHQRIRGAVDGR